MKSYLSDEEKIQKSRIAITNAAGDEIQEYLSTRGMSMDKIDSARLLLENAERLFQEHIDLKAAKVNATGLAVVHQDNTRKKFAEHRELLKVCFAGDKAARRELGLNRKVATTTGKFIAQFQSIYQTLQNRTELMSRASVEVGLTSEEVQDCLTMAEELKTLESRQAVADGESQNKTEEKNAAIAELWDFRQALIRIAKIALAEKPQLLEKLGQVARS